MPRTLYRFVMTNPIIDHPRPFGLIDIESGNMVGSFATEREALLAVAEIARHYGEDSDAARSLSLFRDDAQPEDGFIADGEELVRRALSVADTTMEPAVN